MTTVAIVSQKGGSGKTTLAINLATCAAHNGEKSCVIDTDPQATAAAWSDWRGDFLPEVMTCPPVRLPRMIQKAGHDGFGLIVIDTPPHGDSAAREAVRAADIVLVPVRPRAFDLHAAQATSELVSNSRKPAYVLFNAVPSRATRMLEEAGQFVTGLGFQVCPVRFGERAAFHRSSAAGEVALETEPESKAAGEVRELWNWVRQQGTG